VRNRQDLLARSFDEEVYPLVGQRMDEMLLRAVRIPPRGSILQVGCSTGAATATIAERLDADGRVVALDPSAALIELARARVRQQQPLGRRIFFRTHAAGELLPFAEETFDAVIANQPLADLADPAATLADWARVVKPDGAIVLCTPLRGTWFELLDLYREVLTGQGADAAGREQQFQALDAYIATLPDVHTVAGLFEAARLGQAAIELEQWELVFRTAREFFYAPVIEQGPLPRWKEIAGSGEEMQHLFAVLKETIDTYYAGRPFSVSILAGRFVGHKPGR
jgi:ubiquinone/menaquinone biosynthesis C-methylase UbiE